MSARRLLSGEAFGARVRAEAARRHVPLLVLRATAIERVAWHEGRTAARSLVRRTRAVFSSTIGPKLRRGDLLAHDPRSLTFAVALLGRGPRAQRLVLAEDCRSALARVHAGLDAANAGVESGWTLLGSPPSDLVREMQAALERGAQERFRLDFFSPIAHEMRTPLTAIRGYLETVLEDPPDAATARRFLEIARGETLRLARLLDGVFAVSLLDLDYTSPASYTLPASRERAMVHDALDEACRALEQRLRQRRVRLSIGRMPGRPAAIRHDHLVQIFANLVGNAIEHGEEGGSIVVSSEERGKMLAVAVDDDGPGIPVQDREAVFQLGYRTAASCARNSGTGLGLAVVRRLLERAGGFAAASASPLGGTRITIGLRTTSRGMTG